MFQNGGMVFTIPPSSCRLPSSVLPHTGHASWFIAWRSAAPAARWAIVDAPSRGPVTDFI
jgi:hypothetical protein